MSDYEPSASMIEVGARAGVTAMASMPQQAWERTGEGDKQWEREFMRAALVAVGPLIAEQLIEQRDRARALACRLEEELALIRRAAATRRYP